MTRLLLLTKSLSLWAGECTREIALFCLQEQSIYCPKLKRLVQSLCYDHDDDCDYLKITNKKLDAKPLLELEARSMTAVRGSGQVRSVVAQRPLKILRDFVRQDAGKVLLEAILAAKGPGRVVLGWGDEPQMWKVVG